MDLIKIGRYIASKRRELGLTQRQLAEKLNMSDKSVSKWERGICLPDVSIYSDLCDVLGISLNEFLAGEDIEKEDIEQKSEENIVGVARESKRRQKKMKLVIGILTAVIAAAVLTGGLFILYVNRPQNYTAPIDKDSLEMKTAEILTGEDGAFLYKYKATDKFTELNIFVSEYRLGELISKEKYELPHQDIRSSENGTILVIPDFERFVIRLIAVSDEAKLEAEIPILDGVANRQYYGRAGTQIEEKTDIAYGKEQPLIALVYARNEMQIVSGQDFADGNIETLFENDYVYYFTFKLS